MKIYQEIPFWQYIFSQLFQYLFVIDRQTFCFLHLLHTQETVRLHQPTSERNFQRSGKLNALGQHFNTFNYAPNIMATLHNRYAIQSGV